MSAQRATSARLLAGFGIVGIGVLSALATDVALTVLTPAKLAFALGGFALLIPTMVVADPRAYWLFLLVLSIPFDITKWLSMGMVDSQVLVDTYGMPMSGTVGLEIYLTDVVLVAMLLPWLARVCLRRDTLYFPKVGYLFAFYLAWALLVSLINAASFYLSLFELCRQILYFTSFVYLINNISTRLQFRSVVWAVFFGFVISAGSVIVFFERGIGTDTVAFAGLHDQPTTSAQNQIGKASNGWAPQSLTLHSANRDLGSISREHGSDIQRSAGIFKHPAIPAGLCGLTLPIVLAYLLAAQNYRDRILLFMVYAWGLVALLLTFSRAGLIGFMAGTIVFFFVGGWSSQFSRRALKLGVVNLTLAAALGIPLLVTYYFGVRSETFFMRFNMMEAAVLGYAQHPILGVGLNNSTAAMKAPREELREMGIPVGTAEPADSYYLAILTEVGPVGSILFFGFFGKIVIIAFRSMREVAADMKPLLVGMVAGLAALATQSIADGPLAGHAVGGTLWLFAALVVSIRRYGLAETRPAIASGEAEAALVGA